MVRRLEKRQKEMLLQIDDERRNTGQYKDQARPFWTLNKVLFATSVVDLLTELLWALTWPSTHRLKRQTTVCASWNVNLRSPRKRCPESTLPVGSCRESWTMSLSPQTQWIEKSALWRANSGLFLEYSGLETTPNTCRSSEISCLLWHVLFLHFLLSS